MREMLKKSWSISLPLDLFPAPDGAPLNIQWTMIGSTLTLHWDPVVAMETESKVTGYLVGPNSLQSSDLSPVSKDDGFCIGSFFCVTVSRDRCCWRDIVIMTSTLSWQTKPLWSSASPQATTISFRSRPWVRAVKALAVNPSTSTN